MLVALALLAAAAWTLVFVVRGVAHGVLAVLGHRLEAVAQVGERVDDKFTAVWLGRHSAELAEGWERALVRCRASDVPRRRPSPVLVFAMHEAINFASLKKRAQAPTLESIFDYWNNRTAEYSEFEDGAWTEQARSLVRTSRVNARQRPAKFYALDGLPKERWFYERRDDEYRFLAERTELTALLLGCLTQAGWKIAPD